MLKNGYLLTELLVTGGDAVGRAKDFDGDVSASIVCLVDIAESPVTENARRAGVVIEVVDVKSLFYVAEHDVGSELSETHCAAVIRALDLIYFRRGLDEVAKVEVVHV